MRPYRTAHFVISTLERLHVASLRSSQAPGLYPKKLQKSPEPAGSKDERRRYEVEYFPFDVFQELFQEQTTDTIKIQT